MMVALATSLTAANPATWTPSESSRLLLPVDVRQISEDTPPHLLQQFDEILPCEEYFSTKLRAQLKRCFPINRPCDFV
jgi:hypothetical protein